MKKLKCILVLSIFAILFVACIERYDSRDYTIQVYKFKVGSDYSNNVPVELSTDNKKITSSPGGALKKWPIKLANGYYLNGSMGVNSGYLSLTIDEFNESYEKYGFGTSLDMEYKLLVEKDPYLEFFISENQIFFNGNGVYGIDTAIINNLIRTDNIGNFFDRLK